MGMDMPAEIVVRRLAGAEELANSVIDDFVQAGRAAWGEDLGERIEPLRAAIRADLLDGLVACRLDLGLGLALYRLQDGAAEVSFLHALAGRPDLLVALLDRAVQDLRAAAARRITVEAPILAGREAVGSALAGLGFRAIDRQEMVAGLSGSLAAPAVPPGYKLIAWDDRYLDGAAAAIHAANQGTADALIYPRLETAEGTRRMVHALRGEPGEPFVEYASGLALCDGAVCGAILILESAAGQAFVAELSVRPEHQGRGLGRALLARAMAAAPYRKFDSMALTVTEENTPAVTLYRDLGFVTTQRFTAFVWEAR